MRFLVWAAWLLVALATAATILFDPRVFFGNGQGGDFISFDSWFYSGAWLAVRLASLALVLFAVAAAVGGPEHASWRGAALAALLVCWALVRGVPHADNRATWKRGDVGALTWWRTQQRHRAIARPLGADPFLGSWHAPDGAEWRFDTSGVTHVPSSTPGGAPCGRYRVGYANRERAVLENRGIEESPAAPRLAAIPPQAVVPVASVACEDRPWFAEFARVGDELWVVGPWLTDQELRTSAFVPATAAQ